LTGCSRDCKHLMSICAYNLGVLWRSKEMSASLATGSEKMFFFVIPCAAPSEKFRVHSTFSLNVSIFFNDVDPFRLLKHGYYTRSCLLFALFASVLHETKAQFGCIFPTFCEGDWTFSLELERAFLRSEHSLTSAKQRNGFPPKFLWKYPDQNRD